MLLERTRTVPGHIKYILRPSINCIFIISFVACSDGLFGDHCLKNCNGNCMNYCDKSNGKCIGGCKEPRILYGTWYMGDFCHIDIRE